MSVTVELMGHGSSIMIDVLHYEATNAEDTLDANWLTCQVDVSIRGFRGRIDASFTTQDFVSFASSLVDAVNAVHGGALFETCEDALRVNVEFRSTGTAIITGYLRDPCCFDTSINFLFESDQTYLQQTVQGLKQVTSTFPVRS